MFRVEFVDNEVESSSIPLICDNGNTKIFSKVSVRSIAKLVLHGINDGRQSVRGEINF